LAKDQRGQVWTAIGHLESAHGALVEAMEASRPWHGDRFHPIPQPHASLIDMLGFSMPSSVTLQGVVRQGLNAFFSRVLSLRALLVRLGVQIRHASGNPAPVRRVRRSVEGGRRKASLRKLDGRRFPLEPVGGATKSVDELSVGGAEQLAPVLAGGVAEGGRRPFRMAGKAMRILRQDAGRSHRRDTGLLSSGGHLRLDLRQLGRTSLPPAERLLLSLAFDKLSSCASISISAASRGPSTFRSSPLYGFRPRLCSASSPFHRTPSSCSEARLSSLRTA
jgi:hypothetical protein